MYSEINIFPELSKYVPQKIWKLPNVFGTYMNNSMYKETRIKL
jgi:hypothetical protein